MSTMRTITPGATLKAGYVELSAYWNGTIMFCDQLPIDKYNILVEQYMKKEFIKPEDVEYTIQYLNDVEFSYVLKSQSLNRPDNGYVIDMEQATTHLLMINDLVNIKKVIPDNDMFGLLIMARPLPTGPSKSSKREKPTNITPKKKKRK